MKKLIVLLAMALSLITSVQGQNLFTNEDYLLSGYQSKLSGTDFNYHSALPDLRESLLIRATNGSDFMEWETAKVPASINTKFATFVWISAIGSGPGVAKMDVAVDGAEKFSFFTDHKEFWVMENPDGSSLTFRSIMTDQYGDKHGYMILRIPRDRVKAGEAIKIKVTGGKFNLSSWYMTFKRPVQTGFSVNAFPAILKNAGNPKQLVAIGMFYFGNEANAKIFANNKPISEAKIKFGYNYLKVGIDPVSKEKKMTLKVETEGFKASQQITLAPVKHWKLRFIQHSHTDIGYTRSQTEILAEHLRYIDYALDFCDVTDHYPDYAKFRWTCEASWAVDEYLNCRPQRQIDRLIKRIKEGRIEVTGMYFNFDEAPDEKMLAASLEALGRIKKNGIDVELAMQNDVNGIGWCLNDYYNDMGVKYLNMGTHGHRALICFDKPTMFWWESPSGKKMLTFRAEHYMTGNTVMDIQTGEIDRFKDKVLTYLLDLQQKKYPYDVMAIQHSGYLTDNSPPSTTACELLSLWDELFEWPKLTTSTASGFFKEMEGLYATDFPVYKGAWPDWWTDGFGAGAREWAVMREASADLKANSAGLAMAALQGTPLPANIEPRTFEANNALLFYAEHTTGYSESVREPLSENTMVQRGIKESYAWEANRRVAILGEETMGLLQANLAREKDPTLVVYNTLNWNRSGLITVYIDHQIVPLGRKAGIYDNLGNRMPAQATEHRSDGTYWTVYVKDIPAFGYKRFLIKSRHNDESSLTSKPETVLENTWYKIVADLKQGALKSIIDKENNTELIDQQADFKVGQFILEKINGRAQMESRKLDSYERLPLDTIWFESKLEGDVWTSLKFRGETETAVNPNGYSIEFRLYHDFKRIDIVCTIVKKTIFEPESFYIAFPFGLKDAKHYLEVPGGIMEVGKDQIPGSSNDWYTMQGFTSLRNTQQQIVLTSNQMPLFQFGDINTGRYKAGALPQGPHLFSWPMNNYWVTNFNADQRGGHTWNYSLTSSKDVSNGLATRFGLENRIQFLGRIMPGGGNGMTDWSGSFIKGWPSNLVLISAEPIRQGNEILIQVRETEGETVELKLQNGITAKELSINQVDATGTRLQNGSLNIKPFENKFFAIRLN